MRSLGLAPSGFVVQCLVPRARSRPWWECNSVRYARTFNYREIVLILSKISCRLVINARGRRLCESGALRRVTCTCMYLCVRAYVCACLTNQTEEKFHCAKSLVSQESFPSDCLTAGASRRNLVKSILFSRLLIFISPFPGTSFPVPFIRINRHRIVLQKLFFHSMMRHENLPPTDL